MLKTLEHEATKPPTADQPDEPTDQRQTSQQEVSAKEKGDRVDWREGRQANDHNESRKPKNAHGNKKDHPPEE